MEIIKCIRYTIICILITLSASNVFAQKKPVLSDFKTTKDKLQAWAEYCDEFLNNEDILGLRKVAFEGVALTPQNEESYLSLFNFYLGSTFNYFTESDSAVYYLERSEQYARKIKNSKRIEEALKQLLRACNNVGKVNKRERVLHDLQIIIDTTSTPKRKALLQEAIADYYATNGQYEKAMVLQLAGLKARRLTLSQATNTDSINFAVLLINIAELYNTMEQPDKCIEYLRESQSYIKDYQEGIAHLYKDFIETFLATSKLDSAKLYYTKMLTYLSTIQSDAASSNILSSDFAFAEYYLSNKDLNNTKKSLLHAESLAPKLADEFMKGQLDYLYGKLSIALKQYAQAIQYLVKSEKILKEGAPELYNSLQQFLAQAYAANGNWQKAYHHLTVHALLNDSLRAESSKRNLAEMEAKYQNTTKQEKIDGLSTENGLQKFELQNARQQKIYFVIGLFLLGGIIISMFIIYRNKQRSSKMLEKKNQEMNLLNENLEKSNITKAKLFSIISHDLRNPISQIYQFLDLQKTNSQLFTDKEKIAYNNQISQAAGAVLETMEDLLIWSKTQLQHFSISVESVNLYNSIQQINELLQSQLDQKKMSVSVNIDQSVHVKTDRNILIIILRNLLQNAMVYSPEQSMIQVSAMNNEKEIVIELKDEGAGMPERVRRIFNEPSMPINSSESGLGLTIVKEMAELIQATILISANESQGTRIQIKVPQL
ncbi:MAG: HAMP domain-containing histidine kinase [Bacteroidetes bacterium]|nr:HAMP domain-containing histidine kinase [Bacteroidota bacterium]